MKFFDLERLSYPVRRLIYRVATLAGIGLLVGAGLQAGQSLRSVRNGQHLTGQVIALGTKPFVKVNRPDGQETVFRPTSALVWLHPGQSVPVLLDVTRPGVPPLVATPVALWLMPAVMGVLGALLFNFGFNNKDGPLLGGGRRRSVPTPRPPRPRGR